MGTLSLDAPADHAPPGRSAVRAAEKEVHAGRQGAGWRWPLHPFGFVLFFVTALYASNLREVFLVDLLLPTACVLGFAAAATLAMRLVFPTLPRAAIAASYVLALSLGYSYLHETLNTLCSCFVYHRYMLLGWGLTMVAGLVWLRRARLDQEKVTGLLNLFSMMLVVASLVSIGVAIGTGPAPAAANERPGAGEEEPMVLHRPARPRDIYYLVFDRYADDQTLKDDFDYDNSPFLDALRKRGFCVARESRTNYPSTLISISSALNMRYHDETPQATGQYAAQIQDHRVWRLLKEQGYRYYFLGNWATGLRLNRNADVNYRHSLLPSEFAQTLLETTPFGRLFRDESLRESVVREFEAVREIASEEGAKLVHAHFLLPHPPWLFEEDGSPVPWALAASRSNVENYRNQLAFTNRMILEMIDGVLQRSEVAPIIILQADEGPLLWNSDKDKGPAANLRKRTGILSALYLPGTGPSGHVPAPLSPVNTFRFVFDEYFDAKIPLLPDRTFYWEHATADGRPDWSRPLRFIDVTAEVWRRGDRTSEQANSRNLSSTSARTPRRPAGTIPWKETIPCGI